MHRVLQGSKAHAEQLRELRRSRSVGSSLLWLMFRPARRVSGAREVISEALRRLQHEPGLPARH